MPLTFFRKFLILKKKESLQYGKKLITSRNEIKRLSKITASDRKPVKLDQSSIGRLSRMDLLQQQAMQIETERRRLAELKLIENALKRINDGTYGTCLSCHECIEVERLNKNPSSFLCFQCSQ